ncbi:MAG: ATP-binding protein [Mogibacterium sp.]|nr:ATP-binding protein [Mogibacterium sp.]
MLKDEVSKLLFFKPARGSIMSELIDAEERCFGGEDQKTLEAAVLSVVNRLISLSASMGIDGNLWQNYIIHFALTDENAYTLSRERAASAEDSFSALAASDFAILRGLMAYDFETLRPVVKDGVIASVLDFRNGGEPSEYAGNAGKMVLDIRAVTAKASGDEAFKAAFDEHYRKRGTGDFAFTDAFRIADTDNLKFKPIRATEDISFSDMVGYEQQKAEIMRNTEAFIEGRPANNVLLYGDSGAGKSTSVKALINEYSGRGLRIIEIHKHQFKHISEVLGRVKNRNYKFILFIDDLSFEDFETEYKYLKAVIEGDLEIKPSNVLIYATSNRRHLIKEVFADRADMEHLGDVHRSDTIEEKTSLSSRFGVQIYYPSPVRQEYHDIVKTLAAKAGIEMDEKEMLVQADAWDIRHGGVSCRAARQFVDYLASEKKGDK